MAILQQLEVEDVRIPAPIAVGRKGLYVLAPIHLHVRHARFHEAPRHQAALSKGRLTVGVAGLPFLLRQVKRRARLGIGQQAVRALMRALPVIDAGILQLLFGGVQLPE